jgi:uncharacterized membrane protein YidH (DUF202 family)
VVAKFGILLREVGGSHVHPETAGTGAIVGVLLVVSGIVLTALATLKFLTIRLDIDRSELTYSTTLDVALAALLALAGVTVAVYMIVTA